jgi:GMP synthase (glutamine-hydrolysing)
MDDVRPRILVVEHQASCPPALMGDWLQGAGCALEVCRPWAGDALPDSAGLSAYDGLLVLGGEMNAYDDDLHVWLGPLKELLREAVAKRLPTLGICLGHQLVAVALGGTVEANPRGQTVGLHEVGWTAAAADDALVGPLAQRRRGVQWNNDVVTRLPTGAVVLAESPDGDLQVARFAEHAWGVQLHPEADDLVVRAWAEGDRADHLERGIDQEAVIGGIAAAREELDRAWEPLAQSFVRVAAVAG